MEGEGWLAKSGSEGARLDRVEGIGASPRPRAHVSHVAQHDIASQRFPASPLAHASGRNTAGLEQRFEACVQQQRRASCAPEGSGVHTGARPRRAAPTGRSGCEGGVAEPRDLRCWSKLHPDA